MLTYAKVVLITFLKMLAQLWLNLVRWIEDLLNMKSFVCGSFSPPVTCPPLEVVVVRGEGWGGGGGEVLKDQ